MSNNNMHVHINTNMFDFDPLPASKGARRRLLIVSFIISYCAMIYGIYRVQDKEDYAPLYMATPLHFLSTWLTILAATA